MDRERRIEADILREKRVDLYKNGPCLEVSITASIYKRASELFVGRYGMSTEENVQEICAGLRKSLLDFYDPEKSEKGGIVLVHVKPYLFQCLAEIFIERYGD